MAYKDFVPRKDGELLTYGQNFINYATANTAALGLAAADITALTNGQGPFESAYLALLPAQAAAKAAREARDDARRDYTEVIRRVAKKVQANPNVTNEQRENLGVTVPKPPSPQPVPDTKPLAEIERIGGLVHEIQLIDSGSGKKGKPDDAAGAEMYMKISATPPATVSEMSLAGFTLRTRFEQEFDGTDAGKTCYYSFRWFNSKGQKGPFSPITGATIAA